MKSKCVVNHYGDSSESYVHTTWIPHMHKMCLRCHSYCSFSDDIYFLLSCAFYLFVLTFYSRSLEFSVILIFKSCYFFIRIPRSVITSILILGTLELYVEVVSFYTLWSVWNYFCPPICCLKI
jgi:hypothetical protein